MLPHQVQVSSPKNLALLLKLLIITTVLGGWATLDPPTQAATLALTKGTIANVFTECINDGIAVQVGATPRDDQGWQYAIDSPHDGVNGYNIGGTVYEIYSLALRETNDSIWVAINGNMPLTGVNGTPAADGNIGWGDLFFNFTGETFANASRDARLLGVRFAGTNDSFVPKIGLYSDVKAISTTNINSGFSRLQDYNEWVKDYGCQGQGCGPSLGDLPADTPYFDLTKSLNTIASGQFLTSIMYLSQADLQAAGYDFSRSSGRETIAFKFDKSGICQRGYCQSVPEPSPILGLVILGLMVSVKSRWKR